MLIYFQSIFTLSASKKLGSTEIFCFKEKARFKSSVDNSSKRETIISQILRCSGHISSRQICQFLSPSRDATISYSLFNFYPLPAVHFSRDKSAYSERQISHAFVFQSSFLSTTRHAPLIIRRFLCCTSPFLIFSLSTTGLSPGRA